jgi:hypothetical protein
MSRLQIYWLVILCFVLVSYAIAFLRKGKVGMPMTSRQRTIHVTATPAETFAHIRHIARPYLIDDSDPKLNVVIVSKPVAFLGGFGFFFPVFIAPAVDGGSDLTIGCTSKVVQMGPLVTRAHDKAVQAILQTLALAPARVA